MKIQFLGTAAAEGIPAIFCNCPACREARTLGGKNIRTRCQTLINDDLLIDLNADTYSHFLANNIQGHKIKYLLITHSHMDHCYPDELAMRRSGPHLFAHDMEVPVLQVFGGKGTMNKFQAQLDPLPDVTVQYMELFQPVQMGDYRVTALPARHYPGDDARIYLIQGDKTILYAHDSGYFLDEVFDYLQKEKIRLDMITLDCTCVYADVSDNGNHMGLGNNARVLQRLESIGVVHEKTRKVVNHFSHNGNPLHEPLVAHVAPLGYAVAYDGMCMEL